MDKLEEYLNRVCRGIAGPRAMRQHIRQELREHLKDAIAEHLAAGMPEDQATDRALEDFGGPEVVRAELEATHGHRVMGVIIDKAMQWQERTVKAKSFWSAWAHVALALVIGGEIIFLAMALIFIVPKFEWYAKYNMFGPGYEDFRPWFSRLMYPFWFFHENGIWIIPVLAILWALWEWRIHSDRKPFIRLASMGTLAAALLVFMFITTTVLIVPLAAGVDYVSRRPPQAQVKETMENIDLAVADLEKDLQTKDRQDIPWASYRVEGSVDDLYFFGPSLPGLLAMHEPAAMNELNERARKLRDTAVRIRTTAQQDDPFLEAAAKQLQAVYQPLKLSATTRPAM